MAESKFDNSNRGALWLNDDRREGVNPKTGKTYEDPHFRGNIVLVVPMDEVLDNGNGTVTIHRFISAWESSSQKVGDYLSIAVGKKCSKTHGE